MLLIADQAEERGLMVKKIAHPHGGRNVFEATLARFAKKRGSPSRHRFDALRKLTLLDRFTSRTVSNEPDPISLAIFAIDRIGPAAVRACASGVEVSVAAPDEATAAVCRAALAETAQRRGTDRLIRIIVD
jgi:hypothetical protein